jgi:hypothetical protein
MRSRRFAIAVLLPVLWVICFPGCDWIRNIRSGSKEQDDIQAALKKYLQQRADLNLAAMDMETIESNTDRDRADLLVEFRAKQGEGKMRMHYHLERTNGIWEVKQSRPLVEGQRLNQPTPKIPQPLPPGHPPTDSGGKNRAPAQPTHP